MNKIILNFQIQRDARGLPGSVAHGNFTDKPAYTGFQYAVQRDLPGVHGSGISFRSIAQHLHQEARAQTHREARLLAVAVGQVAKIRRLEGEDCLV